MNPLEEAKALLIEVCEGIAKRSGTTMTEEEKKKIGTSIDCIVEYHNLMSDPPVNVEKELLSLMDERRYG
ncbi:hypothetical protein IMZ31_20460 (plasmid) [Pontibacillus sp. ALD_SL1]|uniref:hypothetical protein n=1 Tax=Pontibacillus sp. ALD_SL1 TaxID=2777185 RepID=UPI001A961E7A|nr:hypothetical protein [Pontibacillus sp. ALD_SL1]QST02923.1 hypothetical protein IMZ31_20460 [Pontibacillus sp. ALD_SL1]